MNKNTQFFPLAAFYEELIDHDGYHRTITFNYETFKTILRSKCGERYDGILSSFWKISIIDYLLCNSRSAGNIGFLDDGTLKLSPVYDNSTKLTHIGDTRFLSEDFPRLLMEFDVDNNSAFHVFMSLNDPYMKTELEFAKTQIDLSTLFDTISSPEERFLFDVITHRYTKLSK